MKDSSYPLLTVACITYNHVAFIHKAIDSFLNQQTNFPIELIIHDDNSTDGTADIVKDYQQNHPRLIKAILRSENQFSKKGFGFLRDVLKQARGKYVAICEGDDYWSDPNKLQQQVDFLEDNPDFSICFHKVQIDQEGLLTEDFITRPPATVTTIDDLACKNYIHTCSCVFRNRGVNVLGPNLGESPLGDYYLHMMNAQYGKIHYIDSIMSVYRIHNSSLWSSLGVYNQVVKTLDAIKCIMRDLDPALASVKNNMIDCSINCVLWARKESQEKDLSLRDIAADNEEYLVRLFQRLSDSNEEIERLNQFDNSIPYHLSRILLLCKIKMHSFVANKLFGEPLSRKC